MAVYNYSVPKINLNGQYFDVYLDPTNANYYQTFAVCKSRIDQSLVFKQGYCGNGGSGSWIARMKNYYILDWVSDTNITNNTLLYFPIITDNGKMFVDWNNPFTPEHDYDYQLVNGSYSTLVSGVSKTVEDSSGSGGSSEVIPSDDPYVNVENAIYTVGAVPIVLCFFFVIYKMFMRLRG